MAVQQGHYSPGYKWWWNEGGERWYLCDTTRYRYLEVEAADVGTHFGRSVVSNLLGSPALCKCQFIARAWDEEEGRWVQAKAEFSKFAGYPIEYMRGLELQDAHEQLDSLHRKLLDYGWIPTERGTYWYSFRYWKPYTSIPQRDQAFVWPNPDDSGFYTYLLDDYRESLQQLSMIALDIVGKWKPIGKWRTKEEAMSFYHNKLAEYDYVLDLLAGRTASLPKDKHAELRYIREHRNEWPRMAQEMLQRIRRQTKNKA